MKCYLWTSLKEISLFLNVLRSIKFMMYEIALGLWDREKSKPIQMETIDDKCYFYTVRTNKQTKKCEEKDAVYGIEYRSSCQWDREKQIAIGKRIEWRDFS